MLCFFPSIVVLRKNQMQQFNLSKGMNLLYLSWGVNPTSKSETDIVQLVNFIHASIEVSDLVPPLQGEGVLDANIVETLQWRTRPFLHAFGRTVRMFQFKHFS